MRGREREKKRKCVFCVDSTGSKLGVLLPCMEQNNMKLLFKKCISHVNLKIPTFKNVDFRLS